jgi:RimJ/RimL family protein N-acetyltransferase
MRLTIRPASPATFAELETWRYEPPYDFYDGDVEPVLNPERFFEARGPDGALVGFYYFEEKGDALEIGLGLRPDLVGRGLGLKFFGAGLEFGRRRFRPGRVILAVAAFNERAVKVYERAGFVELGRHVRRFERWGDVEFVDMQELRRLQPPELPSAKRTR